MIKNCHEFVLHHIILFVIWFQCISSTFFWGGGGTLEINMHAVYFLKPCLRFLKAVLCVFLK